MAASAAVRAPRVLALALARTNRQHQHACEITAQALDTIPAAPRAAILAL
jgi:hypothetical protein